METSFSNFEILHPKNVDKQEMAAQIYGVTAIANLAVRFLPPQGWQLKNSKILAIAFPNARRSEHPTPLKNS